MGDPSSDPGVCGVSSRVSLRVPGPRGLRGVSSSWLLRDSRSPRGGPRFGVDAPQKERVRTRIAERVDTLFESRPQVMAEFWGFLEAVARGEPILEDPLTGILRDPRASREEA